MDRTNADAVAELARQGVTAPQIVTTNAGRELLVLPAASGGATYVDVTAPGAQLDALPEWTVQAVTLQTTESLIEYLNRFKVATTSLFADIDHNRIVGVVDYHDSTPGARLGHRATLDLPFSIEWKTWTGIDGKLLPQLEFARFLEENAADIVEPDAAGLLEACRDLQAKRKVNFSKAVRTASDNESFEYSDETTATSKKGDVELPSRFLLRLPVYFGGETYSVAAFLRWRLEEGELRLGIQLHNREQVRQTVFKNLVIDAADRTDCPADFGRI